MTATIHDNPTDAIAAIRANLAATNGRRHKRVLRLGDIVQSIRETWETPDWFGWTLPGGMVTANSYGYQSYATRVAAIRHVCTRHVQVAIWEGDGRGGGQPSYRAAREGQTTMTERCARRVVRRWEQQARPGAERLIRMAGRLHVPVTVADSIAAGNCPQTTRRVAAWWPGKTSIDAAELAATIAEREPTLSSFAARAITYAVQA